MSANNSVLLSSTGGSGFGSTNVIYSESKTRSNNGVTLSVTAEGAPGELAISVDLSGKVGARFRDFTGSSSTDTVDVRFVPDTDWSATDEIRQQARTARALVSQTPQRAFSPAETVVPSRLETIRSEGVPLFAGVFGQKVAGQQDPPEFSRTVSFSPVKLPTAEQPSSFSTRSLFGERLSVSGVREELDIDSLPEIPIRVEVVPKELVQRSLGQFPSVSLSVPADVIVTEFNLSDVGCSELYPGVDREIDNVSSEVDAALSDLRALSDSSSLGSRLGVRDISSLTREDIIPSGFGSLKDDARSLVTGSIGSEVKLPECAESFADRVDNIESKLDQADSLIESILGNIEAEVPEALDCVTEHPEVDSLLSDLESTVQNSTDVSEFRFSQLQSELEAASQTFRSRVDSGSPCFDEFRNRIDDIRSRLQALNSDNDLDCTDVSSSVRRSVSGFEQQASSVISRPRSQLDRDRAQRLLQSGQELRNRVRSTVSDANPCQSQLIQRIETKEDNIRSRLEATAIVNRNADEILPCSEKHPGASQAVEAFIQTTLDLEPPVTPAEFQELSNQADEIETQVKQNISAGDRCRERFLGRLNTSIGRIERLRSTVRIEAGGSDKVDEETDELVTRLTEQLENLKITPGEALQGGVDPDIPST